MARCLTSNRGARGGGGEADPATPLEACSPKPAGPRTFAARNDACGDSHRESLRAPRIPVHHQVLMGAVQLLAQRGHASTTLARHTASRPGAGQGIRLADLGKDRAGQGEGRRQGRGGAGQRPAHTPRAEQAGEGGQVQWGAGQGRGGRGRAELARGGASGPPPASLRSATHLLARGGASGPPPSLRPAPSSVSTSCCSGNSSEARSRPIWCSLMDACCRREGGQAQGAHLVLTDGRLLQEGGGAGTRGPSGAQ